MTKKHDIVFNLTIDDLKELGIIKKRRRRRQKRITYINGIPSNIKSSSDHMTGYSNVFNNTSNLQTENLRLQNDMIIKYPMIKNDYEKRFKTIEDTHFNNNFLTQFLLEDTYRPALRESDRVEQIDDKQYGSKSDNIDVGQTDGSDKFKANGDNQIEQEEQMEQQTPPQAPPQAPPQTPQQTLQLTPQLKPTTQEKKSLFKSPLGAIRTTAVNLMNLNQSSKIIPTTTTDKDETESLHNMVDSSYRGQKMNYEFRSDDGSTHEKAQAAPPITEPSTLSNTQSPVVKASSETQSPVVKASIESTSANEPKKELTKNQIAYLKGKEKLNAARQEYKDAGGDDETILSTKILGEIRAATILLEKKKKKGKK